MIQWDESRHVLDRTPAGNASALLATAREYERRGSIPEAIHAYDAAIDAADERGEARTLAEALRRLGGICRRQHELETAAELTERSHAVAAHLGDPILVAEALNALALIHFARGECQRARSELQRALAAGASSAGLQARIEQNFGVMANLEGDLETALGHYERSLESFKAAGDERGCAVAYHNIGMNNADRSLWERADDAFVTSLGIADAIGDVYLRGLVLLNRTEVHIARQRFEDGKRSAEEALQIFDRLGAREHKADAYKFLGMLYRDTGRPLLAEARFKTALDLSTEIGATLVQAEATRELGLLYGQMGRNQDTLKLLNSAHRLFGRLNASRDLVDVASKRLDLETIYLDIVRQWGASIESTDTYTYGHSARVADYAVAIATTFGVADSELTTIRVGSHLHDLGKIRVPHEILNKPGSLSPDEFETMKMHPLFGIEMLAAIDFPWDVKPIIRSHHEKMDGSGYPDRLSGEEIPLSAQIVCIADVYDALTTTRSYRAALSHHAAVDVMRESSRWWCREVFDSFMESIGRP